MQYSIVGVLSCKAAFYLHDSIFSAIKPIFMQQKIFLTYLFSKIVINQYVEIWDMEELAVVTLLKCFIFWWNAACRLDCSFLDSEV